MYQGQTALGGIKYVEKASNFANVAQPAPPQTDIEGEIARLNRSVEEAWQAFHRLQGQLAAVLRPECGVDGTATPEAPTTCQLGDTIRHIAYRAEETARYINSVHDRLAV